MSIIIKYQINLQICDFIVWMYYVKSKSSCYIIQILDEVLFGSGMRRFEKC
jgi:hypothetical protein